MFGLSPWIEVPLWVILSFAVAMSVASSTTKRNGQPSLGAVGFFTGCALGPVGVLASMSSQTQGRRGMIFLGGLVGTLVLARILGFL